jgi:hypothetical protein
LHDLHAEGQAPQHLRSGSSTAIDDCTRVRVLKVYDAVN